MKVGLTYNLGSDYQPKEEDPPDAAAEFDTQATIDGLFHAITASGHEPVLIGDGLHLFRFLIDQNIDIVFNIAEGYNGRAREAQIPARSESVL